MKLDTNCVRDILILCENSTFLSDDLSWNPLHIANFSQELFQYSKNQIAYTLLQLADAEYINAHILDCDNGIIDILVYGLTYKGHELVDTIKPKKVWTKLSSLINEVSDISLPILQDVASQFLIELLTKH